MQKTEQISQVQLRHKNERNENAIERKNRIIMGGFRDSAPLSDLAPPPPPHSSSPPPWGTFCVRVGPNPLPRPPLPTFKQKWACLRP